MLSLSYKINTVDSYNMGLSCVSPLISGFFFFFNKCLLGEGNGTPLQYSCLEKSHGRRSLVGCSPWGCEESDMTERLHFHFSFHALEKEIATHSSVLAWRIPGTGEPGGLPSMGYIESDMTEVT